MNPVAILFVSMLSALSSPSLAYASVSDANTMCDSSKYNTDLPYSKVDPTGKRGLKYLPCRSVDSSTNKITSQGFCSGPNKCSLTKETGADGKVAGTNSVDQVELKAAAQADVDFTRGKYDETSTRLAELQKSGADQDLLGQAFNEQAQARLALDDANNKLNAIEEIEKMTDPKQIQTAGYPTEVAPGEKLPKDTVRVSPSDPKQVTPPPEGIKKYDWGTPPDVKPEDFKINPNSFGEKKPPQAPPPQSFLNRITGFFGRISRWFFGMGIGTNIYLEQQPRNSI